MTLAEPTVSFLDDLLSAHGLRRTHVARKVLGWFVSHPDTSYTHAQLQAALLAGGAEPLDRVTLYRQIDRLTSSGLLLCRVDANRVRRYQSMPASVKAIPHFECQTCHRDSVLPRHCRLRIWNALRKALYKLLMTWALWVKAWTLRCVECVRTVLPVLLGWCNDPYRRADIPVPPRSCTGV